MSGPQKLCGRGGGEAGWQTMLVAVEACRSRETEGMKRTFSGAHVRHLVRLPRELAGRTEDEARGALVLHQRHAGLLLEGNLSGKQVDTRSRSACDDESAGPVRANASECA